MLTNRLTARQPSVRPTRVSGKFAEAKAAAYECWSSLGRSTPVDLWTMSREFGVAEVRVASIRSDAMLIPEGDAFVVLLKAAQEEQLQRFSWAHELAHLLLDRHPENSSAFRGLAGDEIELLCDSLAAEILMPADAFTKSAENFGYGVNAISTLVSTFEAPFEQVGRRLVLTHPEHCVLTTWITTRDAKGFRQASLGSLRLDNRGYRAEHALTNGMDHRLTTPAIVLEAFVREGVQSGDIECLIPRQDRGFTGVTVGRAFTEALGVGSRDSRVVYCLSYLDRTGSAISTLAQAGRLADG